MSFSHHGDADWLHTYVCVTVTLTTAFHTHVPMSGAMETHFLVDFSWVFLPAVLSRWQQDFQTDVFNDVGDFTELFGVLSPIFLTVSGQCFDSLLFRDETCFHWVISPSPYMCLCPPVCNPGCIWKCPSNGECARWRMVAAAGLWCYYSVAAALSYANTNHNSPLWLISFTPKNRFHSKYWSLLMLHTCKRFPFKCTIKGNSR